MNKYKVIANVVQTLNSMLKPDYYIILMNNTFKVYQASFVSHVITGKKIPLNPDRLVSEYNLLDSFNIEETPESLKNLFKVLIIKLDLKNKLRRE